jgi:hypothetical protein
MTKLGLLYRNSMFTKLFYYTILLLVSNLSYILTICVNLLGFSFAISLLSQQKLNKLYSYLFQFSLGNLIVMHSMVQSYAELLPYEIVLHAFFYATSYYYFYTYKKEESNCGPILDSNKKSEKKM